MKLLSKHSWMCLFAACLATLSCTSVLPAQDVPEPASSIIPRRGFRGDLSSTEDKFLPLDLNGDGKADMLYYRPGKGFAGAYLSHGDGTFHYVAYTDQGTGYNGFPGDLSSTSDTFLPLDLNGDGKSDFLEYRPGSGFTIRCLSVGDGTVNCNYLSQAGTDYFNFADNMKNGNEKIVTLDMNHNGLADFIVFTPGGGYARLYLAQPNSANLTEITLQVGLARDKRKQCRDAERRAGFRSTR